MRGDVIDEWTWWSEQIGRRDYVPVEGGETDAPYTYMKDLQNGTYSLPWENTIVYTDGQEYGFPKPRKK